MNSCLIFHDVETIHEIEQIISRIPFVKKANVYMTVDDGQFFFNSNQVSKEEWLAAGAAHHSLFEDISNSKIQPAIVTTATYDNGAVWSQAWFWWTGTGKVELLMIPKMTFSVLRRLLNSSSVVI